ncbi:MAG: D-tyrosyl-tRNA(Tyr) deacylase [Ignavibacteriales bacterium]|nr:D-tyrosyl-tRNA(Tyr) deacylase [Ignavibacteriales bacterium]
MRALIQRVTSASVSVEKQLINEIGKGMLIFLGVKNGDTKDDAEYLAYRSAHLRFFNDENGKMNLSVKDVNGSALVISQFTLYGDTRKGHRPSYTDAASPETANELYENFVDKLSLEIGSDKVKKGIFRAMMEIQLVNDGPVTLIVESKT